MEMQVSKLKRTLALYSMKIAIVKQTQLNLQHLNQKKAWPLKLCRQEDDSASEERKTAEQAALVQTINSDDELLIYSTQCL
jgi:hypothetical protein